MMDLNVGNVVLEGLEPAGPPLCINCARYRGLVCNMETGQPDYVLGGMMVKRVDARMMRARGGECGEDGMLFVPKPEDGVRVAEHVTDVYRKKFEGGVWYEEVDGAWRAVAMELDERSDDDR